MDKGTWEDYLEDLLKERQSLTEQVSYLTAQVKFWRTTARTAMDNTDKALTVIELQKALQAEINKAAPND
jgi:uncharacterized protein with PhoU and TrkA domain